MRKLILFLCCLGVISTTFAQQSELSLSTLSTKIDEVWVVLCAVLVFLMQVGFLALEIGMSKRSALISISLKNTIDYMIGFFVFLLFGFGFMFGESFAGFMGTNLMGLQDISTGDSPLKLTFFIFQVGFVTASITIISGALSGRVSFFAYLVISALVGGLVYPIFGHWAWGNLFYSTNPAWLANMGFMDFAGSSVVHALGGWIALIGAYFVKPRLGRFSVTGEPIDFEPYSIGWSALGVLVLWVGWFGFNAGSLLEFNDLVGKVLINTSLAGITAGVTALFHAYFTDRKNIYPKFLGGILAGLVAVTASCNIVSFFGAGIIGILAGLIHNWAFSLLERWNIDDPVGAIPVHAFAGTLGVIIFPIFAEENTLNLALPNQLAVQLLGAVVCFLWASGTSFIIFFVVEKLIGLRLSPEEEIQGISIPNTLHLFKKQVDNPAKKITEADLDKLAKMMQDAEKK